MTKLSVIIPILNEEQSISFLLKELAGWCREDDEVILVDGGSRRVCCTGPAPKTRASVCKAY